MERECEGYALHHSWYMHGGSPPTKRMEPWGRYKVMCGYKLRACSISHDKQGLHGCSLVDASNRCGVISHLLLAGWCVAVPLWSVHSHVWSLCCKTIAHVYGGLETQLDCIAATAHLADVDGAAKGL
jgi:hypothetical protein